jgi:hypothetical protein
MSANIIFSNTALNRMKKHTVSEKLVLDTFNSGVAEKGSKIVKKYSGYEIGLFYAQKPGNRYTITTVWKRYNRR